MIRAPAGRLTFSTDFLVEDKGEPNATAPQAEQHALEDLPVEVLIYLLGSRYCETDRLSNMACSLFGQVRKGWPLVKAVCNYVHDRITFSYAHASPTKTAFDAHTEKWGVCRDFAHLAVTLCRCMNLPARYCTGYLGDIGVPPDDSPMDFSAWFEVYLGGRWYAFDARHNKPRIGRILTARGRDATDVAIVTSIDISDNWIVPVRNLSVLLPFTATLSRLCDCGCHTFVRPVWFLRAASFEIVNRICFVIPVRFRTRKCPCTCLARLFC
jgi:transglutaminase-like putative cysteine protease